MPVVTKIACIVILNEVKDLTMDDRSRNEFCIFNASDAKSSVKPAVIHRRFSCSNYLQAQWRQPRFYPAHYRADLVSIAFGSYAGCTSPRNRSSPNCYPKSKMGAGSNRVACRTKGFAECNFDRGYVRVHCRRNRLRTDVGFL